MNVDSLFEDAKMLYKYCTKSYGYNLFIIDEVDSNKLMKMNEYIQSNNKFEAVKLFRELSRDIDAIRNKYCYNILPHKSSFRQLAKDMYLYLKETWLLYNPEFQYIGYMLRFISTSDYYVIREFLSHRSYSLFYMDRIPLDPDSFYCGYVPLEAILDYIIKFIALNGNK